MRKCLAFLLSCALAACLAAPAAAFDDLPEGHWAYGPMAQALDRGILTGGSDGLMHPTGVLTWGQCLVLLGRAFYPPALSAQPAPAGTHWASGAYAAAASLHVLEQADFLPVSPDALDTPITRQDTAVLVDRVLTRVFAAESAAVDLSAVPLTDFDALPEPYRAGVLRCCARGIIKGKEGGRFAGGDTLMRAEGATLIMRALALVEASPEEDVVLPDQKGDLALPPAEAPVTPPAGDDFSGPLRALDDNSAKRMLLFGTDAVNRFSSKEEANAHTVAVTVPVWRLNESTGEKSPNQLSFRIHEALAGDMAAIFTEIYNDPEQFPIYSIGGYEWRGTTGEHNCGTALDINYLQNYQVSAATGKPMAGECWLPGENPFSIPEDGSVVRIFNKYGYSWGGNAWPSYSNKDYMHFSYLGR